MSPGLQISRVWFDDDVIELQITVSDGGSCFLCKAYVGHAALREAVESLDVFKNQVHGGLLDLRFGEFGPEYANGAFHARFHLLEPGRLFVTCEMETEHEDFARKQVARRATLFVKSEPALLDRFIVRMRSLASGADVTAHLEGA